MQNTHEVRGNVTPLALGPIKELQNPHLMVFLKKPLYTSSAICVSLLLACCKSPSVRTLPFCPLPSSRVSHPWESKTGGGDSGSKKRRLCSANSSLPAVSQGNARWFTHVAGQRGPFTCQGRRQDKDLWKQLFSTLLLLLPGLLQKGSSSLNLVPCGCEHCSCSGKPSCAGRLASAMLRATTGPLCPGTSAMLRFQKQLSGEKPSRFSPRHTTALSKACLWKCPLALIVNEGGWETSKLWAAHLWGSSVCGLGPCPSVSWCCCISLGQGFYVKAASSVVKAMVSHAHSSGALCSMHTLLRFIFGLYPSHFL